MALRKKPTITDERVAASRARGKGLPDPPVPEKALNPPQRTLNVYENKQLIKKSSELVMIGAESQAFGNRWVNELLRDSDGKKGGIIANLECI